MASNLHPTIGETALTSAWPSKIGRAIKGNDTLSLDLAFKLLQTSVNTNSNECIHGNWKSFRLQKGNRSLSS